MTSSTSTPNRSGSKRADDRGGIDRPLRDGTEAVDPRGDGGLQGGRHLTSPSSPRIERTGRRGDATFGQVSDDLLDEERVAPCAADTCATRPASDGSSPSR